MSIQLRSNVFLTINEVPKNAERKVSGYIDFVSEQEALWYVAPLQDQQQGTFKHYGNDKATVASAKGSLISALIKLDNKCRDKRKFTIYSLPL